MTDTYKDRPARQGRPRHQRHLCGDGPVLRAGALPAVVDGAANVEERLRKLQALEEHGVDNWEGYGDAMRSLLEDDED